MDLLLQAYAARKDDITFATLDGGALVQELASNLGELLLRKMKALNVSSTRLHGDHLLSRMIMVFNQQ